MQVKRLLLLYAGILIVACAMAAHAETRRQTVQIDWIKVRFGGTCRDIKNPQLVMQIQEYDDQNTPNEASHENGAVVWQFDPPLEVDPANFFVSIRFDGGRTDCQKPVRIAERTATFNFYTCSIKPVHAVMFHTTVAKGTTKAIQVHYSRDSAACNTGAELDSSFERRVDGLWTEVESLKLQLAYDGKNRDVPDPLIVLSPKLPNPLFTEDPKKPDTFIFNSNVQKKVKGSSGTLKREVVVAVLQAQLAGTSKQGGFDPNARQKTNSQMLQRVGLENLIVTVK